MDRPVRERIRERIVDEPMLVDERETAEARARDGDLEVVAAARPVDDRDVGRVREGGVQQLLEAVAQLRLTSLKKRLSSPPELSSW